MIEAVNERRDGYVYTVLEWRGRREREREQIIIIRNEKREKGK